MISSLYFESRQVALASQLKELENSLSMYPPGTLVCIKNGKYYKYYQQISSGSNVTRIYISKKNIALAKSLAHKMLILDSIFDIKNELLSLNKYLKFRHPKKIRNILNKDSPYYPLLADKVEWIPNFEYDSNPNHKDNLTIRGPMGQFFRSKSEAIIALSLFERKIKYKYEYAHVIGSFKSYPDFTILHPISGEEIIWEHFGLADDKNYQRNMVHKIKNYINNGYIPGHNLIITFETKDHPIDIVYIDQIITYYFQ